MGDSYVCTSALITCTFGLVPCPLVVTPARTVFLSGMQRANIGDFAPITNIASFGMCSAPTNPAVIAATAAAMGVFTPAPCVPAVVSPWIPGKPDVLVQGMPALTRTSRNVCMWLGQISFTNDGQIPMPPPICTPPVGSLSVPTGMQAPLTQSELSSLSGGDREQYDKDMAEAEKAGSSDQALGDAWDKNANDFEKKGDTEKAAAARKNAEQAHTSATEKKNTAMGDVNEKYRQKARKEELKNTAKDYVGKDVTDDDISKICKSEEEAEEFKDYVKKERMEFTRDFYKENCPDMRGAYSEMNAIDFNKPVKIRELPPPNELQRYSDPDIPNMGGFACMKKDDGTVPTPEELGITSSIVRKDGSIVDRVQRTYELQETPKEKLRCLESTARPYPAPVDDNYNTSLDAANRLETAGGGTQLRLPPNARGLFAAK